MASYWAHSTNAAGGEHRLASHLAAVARAAAGFLRQSDLVGEGALAGLLHDIGKYGDLFQKRLADPTHVTGLDHWSIGAWIAIQKYRSLAAAFAVQGHHIGLPSWQDMQRLRPDHLSQRHPLNLRLTDSDPERLLARLRADAIEPERPMTPMFTTKPGSDKANLARMLEVRRLFSALVDADFLDTEAHFQGNPHGKVYRRSGPPLEPQEALSIVLEKIEMLGGDAAVPQRLRGLRRTLADDCLQAAERPTGLFTLTAPTGSGKTLAMLAFALKHAERNRLQRIVMVIPYLTIIEQTAAVYRELFEPKFGPEYIVEHHSMAGFGPESVRDDSEVEGERRRRLLAENWDAPIVVTTSVQILESLFSNRPSSCRKLHRLAHSVLLFDEVQTLPVALAVPALSALSHIASRWGGSVMFATATQPAFEHLDSAVKAYVASGWSPSEIVQRPSQMNRSLRRVRYRFPGRGESTGWTVLAEAMQARGRSLCIVNLKRHARTLYEVVAERGGGDSFHLSTNLCPLHRRQVLDRVRERLDGSRPCRLVATQCVEAGVDVDFPAVWRAMAPLDAIIQAAGRCNRNGTMASGEMTVFLPEETPYPPMPGYLQATKVTESLINTIGPDAFDPEDAALIERYYRQLYRIGDPAGQSPELVEAIEAFDFPEVARRFRVIANDSVNVVVPWRPAMTLYRELCDLAEREGLTRQWIEAARPLSVSLYRPRPDDAIWDALLPVPYFRGRRKKSGKEEWFIYLNEEDYHDDLGLTPPGQLHLWIA